MNQWMRQPRHSILVSKVTDGNHYFEGIIDEVHISNVVRTQAEIKKMMEAASALEGREKLSQVWANLKVKSR